MQVLRDPDAVLTYLSTGSTPSIGDLIQTRLAELLVDGYSMEELVFFVIVEAGDTMSEVEAVLGGPMHSPGGHPLWECIQAHEDCYEMVFVLSSTGYGTLVLVPHHNGSDELLTLCRLHTADEGASLSP